MNSSYFTPAQRYLRQHPVKAIGLVSLFLLFWYWYHSAHTVREPIEALPFDSMDFVKEEINGDTINFRWSHATNNRNLLKKALKDNVHGIEADVILRNEGTPKQALVPVMAHPPVLDSDLTLDDFLSVVLEHGKSIVKLDFKSMPSVELSLQIITSKRSLISVPIWLNADIVEGPGSPGKPPVQASLFLNKLRSEFNDFTLSLGWSTSTSSKQSYSWAHVNAMYNILKEYFNRGQSLTFPVNAALLKGSVIPIKWLCEQFDASVTLFQSKPEDEVDISELVYIRSKFPKSRVYYDLQPQTLSNFKSVADDLNQLTEVHKTTDKYLYQSESWVLKVTDDKTSEMLLSSDVVWLRGADAMLSSVQQVSYNNDLILQGVVTFLPQKEKMDFKSNLQVYLFGKDHMNNHPTGIRVSLNSNGRMIITADHVSDLQIYEDEEVTKSADNCYQFEIIVLEYEMTLTVRVPVTDCHTLDKNVDGSSRFVQEKSITHKFSKRGLVSPYSVILRNSGTDGFTIVEQIEMHVTPHRIQV